MNHYPDGHNLGPGMVYDTPEEKEIERLNRRIKELEAQLSTHRPEAADNKTRALIDAIVELVEQHPEVVNLAGWDRLSWAFHEHPLAHVDGRSLELDLEDLKVTLGCCLALMAQSGNPACEEMARRIPFTIRNGEPYALVGSTYAAPNDR